MRVLLEDELPALWQEIKQLHKQFLAEKGVKLPEGFSGSPRKPTKNGLVLMALYKYAGQIVTKSELTEMVRSFYPDTSDVQQARHLGRQGGFYILSGNRNDSHHIELRSGDYCLVSLRETYPGFIERNNPRAARGGKDFDELRARFDFRCATCGSKEGEPNFKNLSQLTALQQGHMNPNLPLSMENMIPQCSECNRAYKDKFIFDGNGRVADINVSSAFFRTRFRTL